MLARLSLLLLVCFICCSAVAKAVDQVDIGSVKAAFNRSADNVRLVSLLSPT
jgi:hypothetical protein